MRSTATCLSPSQSYVYYILVQHLGFWGGGVVWAFCFIKGTFRTHTHGGGGRRDLPFFPPPLPPPPPPPSPPPPPPPFSLFLPLGSALAVLASTYKEGKGERGGEAEGDFFFGL